MNSAVTTAKHLSAAPSAGSETWNELVAAMPIVIFYRAVRELFRQRAHKRAVLAAFRR